MSSSFTMRAWGAIACAAVVSMGSAEAGVLTPLSGSGPNLPIPATNLGFPLGVAPTVTPNGGGFDATWGLDARPDWRGTYSNSGINFNGAASESGTFGLDFAGLPRGVLPAGSFVLLSDIDSGSSAFEEVRLLALGAGGSPLSNPWLSEPVGVAGAGSALDMPDWSFSGGQYIFTGASVPGNPTVGIMLVTLVDITFIEGLDSSAFHNVTIHAPLAVPSPGSLALFATAGVFARRRR